MTKNKEKVFDKILEKTVREELQRQYIRGLSQGCKAMCGVILEKANKYNSNNSNEVIADIKKFCEVSLALPEQK